MLCELPSYITRTVMLHANRQVAEWRPHLLGRRVVDLLRTIAKHLNSGHLAHYHKPSINLLQGLCRDRLRQMAARIDSLVATKDNIQTALRASHTALFYAYWNNKHISYSTSDSSVIQR